MEFLHRTGTVYQDNKQTYIKIQFLLYSKHTDSLLQISSGYEQLLFIVSIVRNM
jgi:hypothetical protein